MHYINFNAIINAYANDESARHDFHGIFAAVSSFLYWRKIQLLQIQGVNEQNALQIERSIEDFCETPAYIRGRMESALLKVIRFSVALNSDLSHRHFERFIVTKLKRNESGFYDYLDAERLAFDIAEKFKQHVGKDICDSRWDLR